jgi:soluble lytic murein transglycosylase
MVLTVSTLLGLTNTTLYAAETELEQFQRAWDAAKKGDHESFNNIKDRLQDYLLFPYLQYEDYRNRRADIGAEEMSAFLIAHQGWAFTSGLRTAWLNTLARNKRWAALVKYSERVSSTKQRCQRLRGQIILKQTDGILSEAQKLWTVGKSQPDECDPVFAWLVNTGGIPESLAWKRIQLAMAANNRSLATYLSRYVPKNQRVWVEDWRKLSRAGYARMEKMRNWPDNETTALIAAASLKRLARDDASLAARKFQMLDGHFDWDEASRAGLLRDIALYSAVALEDDTSANMERVPGIYRDSQLLEWWARFLLSREDWTGLMAVIKQFPEDTSNDDRWRYWLAQAQIRSGEIASSSLALANLANRASYYGFLAADELDLAYNICPLPANVDKAAIDQLAARDDFQRALELRKAKLDNWAINEWSLATSRLSTTDLKSAAALAQRESWNDRVIFALGNSGDLRIYEWRFPLIWELPIKRAAAGNQLDPEWVFGTIRSESAMVETARSSANARGLMQITPATGKRVAKKHGLPWSGIAQLMTAEGNLPIGTAFMRDLLDEFDQNPVLVSGAYNAGPNAVKRWLKSRPIGEATIWIETLPYYETRDYIPRVLAFTTIYNWRMGGELKRISSRMPHIESGKIGVSSPAGVECRDPT